MGIKRNRMILNERLRNIRQNAGVSQEDFAQSLNVSHATINNWECKRNELKLSHDLLIKIFDIHRQYALYLCGFNDMIYLKDGERKDIKIYLMKEKTA